MIEYVGHRKVENVGDSVEICPGGTYNSMYLWSPKQNFSFDNAANKFLDISNLPFPKPLQEASNMDLKTFYETYKNQKATKCFETPAELWPEY